MTGERETRRGGIGDGGGGSSLEELEDDEAPRAFLPHVQAVFVPPPWLRSQEIARTYLLCSLHKQCSPCSSTRRRHL